MYQHNFNEMKTQRLLPHLQQVGTCAQIYYPEFSFIEIQLTQISKNAQRISAEKKI